MPVTPIHGLFLPAIGMKVLGIACNGLSEADCSQCPVGDTSRMFKRKVIVMRIRLVSRVKGALALLALMGLSLTAMAQEIDPGLWEARVQMTAPNGSGPMGQMQEELKNLPPEMQEMMKQQMASMGVGMDGSMDLTVKQCVTPEDAKRGPVQEGQTEDDCTYTQVKRKGNTWTGKMVCTDPDMKGDFTNTVHSRRHHAIEAVMTGPEVGKMVLKQESRWQAADCGEHD